MTKNTYLYVVAFIDKIVTRKRIFKGSYPETCKGCEKTGLLQDYGNVSLNRKSMFCFIRPMYKVLRFK